MNIFFRFNISFLLIALACPAFAYTVKFNNTAENATWKVTIYSKPSLNLLLLPGDTKTETVKDKVLIRVKNTNDFFNLPTCLTIKNDITFTLDDKEFQSDHPYNMEKCKIFLKNGDA